MDYLDLTGDQRDEYHNQFNANFPLFNSAVGWEFHIGSHREEESQIRTACGPDTAIIHDLIIRLLNPKGVHYEKWLHCTNIFAIEMELEVEASWKILPGVELTVVFANACRYELVGTAEVMLESSPYLATSGNLLEVVSDNGYTYILRSGTLYDLLDVAIYFSNGGFVDLLLIGEPIQTLLVRMVAANSYLH